MLIVDELLVVHHLVLAFVTVRFISLSVVHFTFIIHSVVYDELFQELVELIRTKKLAQAAAASAKKN